MYIVHHNRQREYRQRLVLCKQDTENLVLCKNTMDRGECPPLVVVLDPYEGFTVEVDRCIKDLTIITEYVGDVDYLSNREDDYDGDNMMTLLHASDPSQCLVIFPNKRSNIARFISGINNHTPVLISMLQSSAENPLQIGELLTRGHGTGGNPLLGEQAAEESKDAIANAL